MKGNFKIAASLFGYLIITGIMCTVCFISMKMIFNFVFTSTIGYEVRGTLGDSEEREYLYTYIYDEDDKTGKNDTQWKEYEEKGYKLYKYAEKTKLSRKTNIAMNIITQIISLLSTSCFIYSILNSRGYKDGTLVRSGNAKPDKFRGLKIGLIASVPAFISFIAFVIFCAANKGVVIELYMIYNACFWPLLELMFTSTPSADDIMWWQFIVMFLLQLVIPALSEVFYFIAYKDYEILGKVIYKKKKKG